jgi:hypothetical protein
MNRETNKSDDNERRESEVSSSASPSGSSSADGQSMPESGPDLPPTDQRHLDQDQFIAKLKRNLEQYRLPADQREQILAELPPPEERERLYRELQEKGGMSFDQFMKSLGLEVHPQP